jgi:uncharacterized protein YndB with AHSA1/START domain
LDFSPECSAIDIPNLSSVTLVRRLKAPPARIFVALTTTDQIGRW